MIRLKNVHKSFGDKIVLNGFNLEVEDGEILSVMGGSGTGKSVTLKHMVGLLRPDSGEVYVDDYDMTQIKGEKLYNALMNIGFIFQSGALFDSMSVYENVAFYLLEHKKRRGKPINRVDIPRYVKETLESVGLENVEHLDPADLSGGMRKRVALARSVVYGPKYLLYDEPTTGLDPNLSKIVAELILKVHNELNGTTVVVTHDLITALKISTRIALLEDGVIKFIAKPEEFMQFDHPTIAYFRQMIGRT